MAAVLEGAHPAQSPAGGSFLFTEVGNTRIVTPESLTEEQRQYFKTALQFAREQVLPLVDRLEKKDNALWRELFAKAGEIGLLVIDLPEDYGGLALDKTTSMLVTEAESLYGSWSATFGGHVGIGSLPIAWFGNEQQKRKYLPKFATGEWIAAYALTETGSGSDALGAKTKAVRSPDGKHWILNGSKQFITNAGFADVFVVFAKVDGEKFTGFIVERTTPGLTIGPEEHKMGLRGSSTCPLIFEDARVPVENVLGEIGKGHKIAFNILNLGRLKLGAGVLGGMKLQIENALRYAQDRKQFGTPIAKFPILREKLARMCQHIYAIESMTYRTSGLIDGKLASEDRAAADYDQKTIAAIEEFNIEASIIKVAASEALGLVVDEAVQIHGGYGYIEEYPVERAYRDARVNRIYEGTNEINRMLISGMLLKRAMKGQLPLLDWAQAVVDELAHRSLPKARGSDELAQEALTTEYLKRMAAVALKAAVERFGPEIESHQEVLAAVADIVMDAYALDTIVARTRQAARGGKLNPVRVALCRMTSVEAQSHGLARARKALCASVKGQELTDALAQLDPLALFTPYDPAELREAVMAAIEAEGGYPFKVA
jgi:alkylation response protein AidB-like acyl-CoA dehydrogenase